MVTKRDLDSNTAQPSLVLKAMNDQIDNIRSSYDHLALRTALRNSLVGVHALLELCDADQQSVPVERLVAAAKQIVETDPTVDLACSVAWHGRRYLLFTVIYKENPSLAKELLKSGAFRTHNVCKYYAAQESHFSSDADQANLEKSAVALVKKCYKLIDLYKFVGARLTRSGSKRKVATLENSQSGSNNALFGGRLPSPKMVVGARRERSGSINSIETNQSLSRPSSRKSSLELSRSPKLSPRK